MKYKISICVLFFVFIHIINGDNSKSELVFIYNVKSGIINLLIDFTPVSKCFPELSSGI